MSRNGTLGLVFAAMLASSQGFDRGGNTRHGPDGRGLREAPDRRRVRPVTNLKLTSGHFECVLAAGRASFVKAGEDVVGIFFDGSGTMEYVSVDPIEAPW